MRFTSETSNFPWSNRNISYIFIDKQLNVFQVGRDMSHESAYNNLKSRSGKLIAVWPGNYTSDAFLVDKPDEYGAAFGLVMTKLPVKIVGYKRDTRYDSKISKYVLFYLETKDDAFHFSDTFMTQLSMLIQKKFGWQVCTSKGYSSWFQDGKAEVSFSVMLMGNPIKDSWGTCFDGRRL